MIMTSQVSEKISEFQEFTDVSKGTQLNQPTMLPWVPKRKTLLIKKWRELSLILDEEKLNQEMYFCSIHLYAGSLYEQL